MIDDANDMIQTSIKLTERHKHRAEFEGEFRSQGEGEEIAKSEDISDLRSADIDYSTGKLSKEYTYMALYDDRLRR